MDATRRLHAGAHLQHSLQRARLESDLHRAAPRLGPVLAVYKLRHAIQWDGKRGGAGGAICLFAQIKQAKLFNYLSAAADCKNATKPLKITQAFCLSGQASIYYVHFLKPNLTLPSPCTHFLNIMEIGKAYELFISPSGRTL